VFRHHNQASGIIKPGVLQQIAFGKKVLQKALAVGDTQSHDLYLQHQQQDAPNH
jgi:hypothetical protein